MAKIKTYLTSEEIQAMVASTPYLRDQALITLYMDTGIRVSEALKIHPEHVDTNTREVIIPHLKHGSKKICPKCHRKAGKATAWCSYCGTDLSQVQAQGLINRSRIITIGEKTAELLERYLKEENPEGAIFPMTRQNAYYIIRRAAEAIGLKGKVMLNPDTGRKHYVHPHTMRDSLAVFWLGAAGDNVSMQKALQQNLGHVSFNTTMHYHKLAPHDVRKIGDEVRRLRFQGTAEGTQRNGRPPADEDDG